MLTDRTRMPVLLRRITTGDSGGGSEVSYLCAEDKHGRCTGLTSPGGRAAYLCGCDCGCNQRARTNLL